MTEAQKEYYLITKDELDEVFSFVQHAPDFTQDIQGDVLNRPAIVKSDAVLDELEKKMISYFDTGYESEDLQFVEDCFAEYRQQQKGR